MTHCDQRKTDMKGTHVALPDERNESILIYINGEFVPRNDAKVSVFDSAFLVGDGIWEGLRLHHGQFSFVDRHMDRLLASADAFGFEIGKTRDELIKILQATVEVNNMHDGAHVRLMISRGTKKTPSQDPRLLVSPPTIVCIAEHKLADPTVSTEGIALITSSVRRPPPDTLDQRYNSHSKLHEVVALLEAIEAGADEALMVDTNGHVATCNATNFFIIRDGAVWTSSGQHCLNGITRGLVVELAREAGMQSLEHDFLLDDVYSADEAFVTGTFGALTPVGSVDGHVIGDGKLGPVTQKLTDLYQRAIADRRP
jgi:branched-chain amino acid aminotransferase